MAEEFQGGVCGGNWAWSSSRNLFGSSPCALATNDIRSFGWPNHDMIMNMKTARSSDDSAGSASDDGGGDGSVIHQDVQKSPQMIGITLSSSITTSDEWNPDLLHDSGRSMENYSNFLLDSSMNYRQKTKIDFPQIHKNWDSNNSIEDSSINSFEQVNQSFPLQQQPLNLISPSTECTTTCSGLSAGFPLNSASYSYNSSLLQNLFDSDSQPQQSLVDNQAMNYSSSAATYQVNSNEFLPSFPKASPMVNPSLAKQQSINSLPLINNTPLWNATAATMSNVRSNFLPSIQSQFLPSFLSDKKTNLPGLGAKHQHEKGNDLASVAKKVNNGPAYKRPRIETPSPLPTFKVRKEKLGDRITALQQLVSPFGKTDTASVLHEAIEYIKFLHDQVNALSTPYLKYGSSPLQRQKEADKPNDQEGLIKDLRSRGLCLVPISSTFPVAAETTSDFWTPRFGGNLK